MKIETALATVWMMMTFACWPLQGYAASEAATSDSPMPVKTEVSPGSYTLDKDHASLIFQVSHLGFSNYTARFTRFDADLHLDPADPAGSRIEATIDPRSLDPGRAPAGFIETLLGAEWLDAAAFPEITFRSTKVELTGPDTARITGDFSLHGVTRPVTMDAKFNGGYASHPMDPMGARIGFSGHGSIQRSLFGIAFGIPPAGSSLGVSDEVEFVIEAEFNQPTQDGKAAKP